MVGASEELMPILINLIIGVILTIASTLLQQAFAKPQEQRQARTGTRGSALFGGKVPQYFLVGTVGEAGKREYRNAWGTVGGVPNAYNVDVYSFGDLPITALARIFVNGVLEPISGSGHVDQGYPSTGDKAGKFWVEFFDGSQTTASAYLLSKFGADADRPWTADMIGRGVPYLTATALWSEGLWTSFPEIVGEFQGIPLYDITKDSTAGGDGPQRWAGAIPTPEEVATWTFSDNNMVIIYNIARGIHYNGAKIWGGSSTAAQLRYDVFAPAIEACDQAVALDGGGTEKRFRAGRRIGLNERPADVIKELLIGCNGRISHASDGTVYVLVGVPDEADGAFTDADVLASEPLGSIPFPNLDEVINGAAATYREPEQAWEDKETAPYLRSDLVDEDDGREHVEGLDLGTTFSGTQAQRVLKAVIEEGRRFRRHVVALPPEFAVYRPLSVLAWTSDRFDYVDKLFLVTARTRDPWGKVVLGLQEIDPADHDWNPATDEQPMSFAPVVTNRPAPQAMTGWGVEPYVVTDNDSNARRPAILVEFAGELSDVRAVRIQVRLADTLEIVFDGETPYDVTEAIPSRVVTGNWCLPNEDYEVAGLFLPFSGRETQWSAWLAVTTPDVRLTDLDVDLDAISAEISESLQWIGEGVRQAIRNFERLGTTLAEQDLANFNDRQALTRELRKKVGDLEASFVEIIEVALGPGGAIATKFESLYAALGGNSAHVNVRFEAVAAPAGVSARWAVQVATDGVTFQSAGIYLEVTTLGVSRIVLDADQTVITTDGGATVSALFNSDGAIIKNLETGTIIGPGGASFWNLTTGVLRVST